MTVVNYDTKRDLNFIVLSPIIHISILSIKTNDAETHAETFGLEQQGELAWYRGSEPAEIIALRQSDWELRLRSVRDALISLYTGKLDKTVHVCLKTPCDINVITWSAG